MKIFICFVYRTSLLDVCCFCPTVIGITTESGQLVRHCQDANILLSSCFDIVIDIHMNTLYQMSSQQFTCQQVASPLCVVCGYGSGFLMKTRLVCSWPDSRLNSYMVSTSVMQGAISILETGFLLTALLLSLMVTCHVL